MKITNYIFCLSFLMFGQAYADDSKNPSVDFHNLSEKICNEKQELLSSKGKAERKGKDLFIWLPGYSQKDNGIVFRDGPADVKKEEQDTFKYCGSTKNYDLVYETFSHDAPMVYLIEKNGRKHRALIGTKSIHASKDQEHLIFVSTTLQPEPIILEIRTAQTEKTGSYNEVTYDKELQCKLTNSKEDPAKRLVQLKVDQFTNDTIVVTAFKENSQIPLGKLKLIRKNEKWQIAEKSDQLKDLSCE